MLLAIPCRVTPNRPATARAKRLQYWHSRRNTPRTRLSPGRASSASSIAVSSAITRPNRRQDPVCCVIGQNTAFGPIIEVLLLNLLYIGLVICSLGIFRHNGCICHSSPQGTQSWLMGISVFTSCWRVRTNRGSGFGSSKEINSAARLRIWTNILMSSSETTLRT